MSTANTLSITSSPGLVSIVIPCCGMLDYTRLCVPSIRRHTREPYELIFLDIGSLDGTAEYLGGLSDGLGSQVRVEVCRAATDLDIANVCKEALDKARGDFVCLLNNDTVVTAHWLDALVALAQYSEANGLVGPMSNYAAPPQLVETVPYRVGSREGVLSRSERRQWTRTGDSQVDVDAVDRFAREFKRQNQGKWLHAERLGGFCLLVRRAVLNRIGAGLNDWTDLGLFDTDILSAKAHQAGFRLAVCRDLFIHHFGTRTFAHGAPQPADAVNGRER